MSPDTSVRPALSRLFRRALPWALALAVATCTDDSTGPSKGGVGYFAFRPVYSGVSASLSQFGIVADSVHVLLTRPIDEVVLDTTVFFPPDSLELRMALPVMLEQSPETLSAMIEIKSGGVVLFVDTLDVQVIDGPPNAGSIATATLDYVGPGNNIKAITVAPSDTTIFFGDTLFYTSTAVDSNDNAVASYYVAWRTSDTAVAKINAQGRLIAPPVRGTVRVIGYTPTGIADTADITFAPVPSQLLADSGAAQSGLVGDSLAQLFVAQVRAADNLPVEGIHVRFTVSAGGAVRDTLLVSDVNGRVRTRGVLGTTAGAYTYTATIVGTAISANFTGTATVGAPAAIAISAGNNQVDSAGRVLPVSLAARVADAFNNPVPGVKVYWTRTVGSGVVAADSSFTSGTGIATIGYTLGAVGVDSITATIAGTGAFVAFRATAINGLPATVQKNLGDAQSDTVGQALTDSLVVIVRSATTQPVVGTPVVWTVLRGGSTSDDTVFTDVNGRAAVAYGLGNLAGTDSVRAAAGAVNAIFTANALAGAATALAIVSGDAQTDTTGLVLPDPFLVRATDSFGNPVAGTKVLWAVVSGSGTLSLDSSFTNAGGDAFSGYTLGPTAGTDSISATLACSCATVTFTATAVSAAPASISTVSGDSQTVVVNTAADTFAVVVRDGANNPIAGAKVDWTFIPAVGSFTEILPAGVQSTYTDSLGIARGVFTAGTSVDTVRIEASVAGHIDSLYLFTVADAPSSIAIQSGDLQVDTIYRVIDVPFVARVTDAYGNPVANAMVAFTKQHGVGTLFADSVATDANGDAAVGYLHGGVPGTDTIRATLAGTGAFVDFQAIAVAGTAASFNNQLGDGQTDTVHATLATALSFEVLDAGGHPVPGAVVTFSTTPGAMLFTPATDTAGIDGVVSTVAAFGDSAGVFDVTAQLQGSPLNIHFSLVATHGAPALLTKTAGDLQTDTAGVTLPLPLQVHVTDAYANPIAGAQVAFTRIAGNGLVTPDTATSDGSGFASASYTLGGIPAVDTVRAVLVANGAQVFFREVTVAATPAFLSVTSGDGQSQTVGTELTDTLVARVYNAGSVPIAGIPLVWSVIRGGSLDVDTVVSDSLGFVKAIYTVGTVAGTDSIRIATLDSALTGLFRATALAGAPAAMAYISGDGQADTTNTPLAAPFVVRVEDAYGNPVLGAAVLWELQSGTGSADDDTTFTDINGLTQVNYTVGGLPAVEVLRATLVGTSTFLDFTTTVVSGAPAFIAKVLGDGQVDTVLATLADSFIVELRSANNSPVPNTWLYWIAAGGTVSNDSTLTDASGRAAVTVTLGSVKVPVSVLVHNADTTVATGFSVATRAGEATQLTAVGGLGQSAEVATALPLPFGALVQDAHGNPVDSGVAVIWSNIVGFAGGLPDTTLTDSVGVAYLTSPLLTSIAGEDSLEATILGTAVADTFTATALPGAAGTVSYVSGTGQFGTVGNMLAGQFNVQVRDAGANPVAGTWVHWTVIAGNGSFPVDSAQTDVGGISKITLTLGTIAGIDSAIATVDGVADTVVFYAQANAGAPAIIGALLGSGQSGEVLSDLAEPLEVQVTDQYGNPLQGVTVDFGVASGPGGGFANPSALTNTVGIASSGTVNLAANPGTTIVEATTAVLPTDTVRFTFYAVPIGTSARWTGGTSSDWADATNWTPEVVPTGTDDIFVPVGVSLSPVLDGPRAIGGLTIESGGNVDVGGNVLTVNGDLVADGTITRTSGHVILAATSGTARGDLGAIEVTGEITLNGPTTTTTSTQITAGRLIVGGQTLNINGDLDVSGTGAFTMTSGSDSVTVTGTASFAGSSSATELTNGVLILLGDLVETSVSPTFRASNLHRTRFVGSVPQLVSMTAAGLGQDQFQTVSFENASGVNITTDFAVGGDALVNGPVTGAGARAFLGGSLVDEGVIDWNVSFNEFAGIPSVLPDTLTGNVDITGVVNLADHLIIQGQVQVLNGNLNPNGHILTIGNGLFVDGTGVLTMQSAADSVDITGTAHFQGNSTSGFLTDGKLVLRDAFLETSVSPTFQASGNHTTIFAGSAFQTIQMVSAALGTEQFRHVIVDNAAGVRLNSDVVAGGDVTLLNGSLSSNFPSTKMTVGGNIVRGAGTFWQADVTELAGNPTILTDSIQGDLQVTGTVTLPNDLLVTGSVYVPAGSVTLNGNALRIGGTFDLDNGAVVAMNNSADTLEVGQSTTWNGSNAIGLLTDGTSIFHGSFVETSSLATYRAAAPHKTVFAGSATQIALFSSPEVAGEQFGDVEFANAISVDFNSSFTVGGTATVSSGVVNGSGVMATITGGLIDATNTSWLVEDTKVIATPSALPSAFTVNLEIAANYTLPGDLVVGGNLTHSAGTFAFDGHTLRVDGQLLVNGTAAFVMQNATDSLDVAGLTYWAGSATPGLLTEGVAVFRGDFSELSTDPSYQSTGNHRTVFAGTVPQGVTFTFPAIGADQFENVTFANPAGVTTSDFAAVNATVIDGEVTSFGAATATIGGTVIDTSNVLWRPNLTRFVNAVTSLPDSFANDVEFAAGGSFLNPMLVVKGDLTIGGASFGLNGRTLRVDGDLTITAGAEFSMTDGSDSVDVGGLATWNGATTTGLLTSGVLVLRGGFSVVSGSPVFQAEGSHRTVFAGGATHNISVNSAAFETNHFHHIELRDGAVLELGTDLYATGALSGDGVIPATVGSSTDYRLLAVRGLSIGNITFDSVRVTKSGPTTQNFNNVTFQRQDPFGTQLTLIEPGYDGIVTFSGMNFQTAPMGGGLLVAVADTLDDGNATAIHMYQSTPFDGSAFALAVPSSDTAYVRWSTLAFVTQPVDVATLTTMAPVEVALLNPAGDTATWYSGQVGVDLIVNPSGATLGGTTLANASSGVAVFSDLTLDLAGVGYQFTTLGEGTPALSALFNVTLPLPVGFDVQWIGANDNNWFNAANWSTGEIPGDTTNVYIGAGGGYMPDVPGGFASVKRLRLAPTATLTVQNEADVHADSSVEAGGGITGGGELYLEGDGAISGPVSTATFVTGTYAVDSVATFGYDLYIAGDLSLTGADSLNVTGLLGTLSGTGRLIMTDAQALVDVSGSADFSGGSTDGQLTAGTLRIAGGITTGGGNNDAFAPDAGHLTILNGPVQQLVSFNVADTGAYGSHFGDLQVSTSGVATMLSPTWIEGNLNVTTGATFADTFSVGIAVMGVTSLDAGAGIAASRLALAGALTPASGSSYSVPLTVYFGDGAPLGVNWAPYDTLQISADAYAAEDLLVTGSLRVIDGWGAPARFDLDGMNVVVSADVNVTGDGAIVMQNTADSLLVGGNFITNGASTEGLLTAGWLRIAGGFHQVGDGSTEAFRAGPNHVTEFYFGGPTGRSISFENPSQAPGSSLGSHFGALLLPIGYDTITGRVPAKGKMFVAAAIIPDTTFPASILVGYDSVHISSASPSIQLPTLEVWGGLEIDPGASYTVASTRIMGGDGGTLPDAPFNNLLIANTSYTLNADLTLPGSLDLGIYCSEVCTSSPGELTVGGHVLTTGGDLRVMGLGMLNMATGDSVDVSGESVWRGAPNSGHLTGGTLVVRGRFNTVGGNVFQASAGHRTVMAAPGVEDIYPTSGMSFGTLVLLDGAPRRVRSSPTVVVLDSLILGANTSGLNDTLGFGSGELELHGPVVTVVGSSIYMDGPVRFDHDSILVSGAYRAGTTMFAGTTQPIPDLAYESIAIQGSAFLTAPLDNTGYNVGIYEGVVPTDLDLAGHRLVTGTLTIDGNATLTMTSAADTLVARGGVNFNGGNESGRLTAGVLQVYGTFTQSNTYSDSSFVATGTHETRFDDSSGTQFINPTTMFAGASRFNHLTVTGQSAWFTSQGWVGGAVTIANPATTVTGGTVTLGAALTDPYYKWMVDSTRFLAAHPVFPDSLDGTVEFMGPVNLSNVLRIGGDLTIHDSMVVNSNLLKVYGNFAATDNGLLRMTNAESSVDIGANALFDGATSTGNLTGGGLTIRGSMTVGPTNGLAFDATGNHSTSFVTVTGSQVEFLAAGGGFQNLTYSSAGMELISDITIRGDLNGSGETPGNIYGNNHLLTVFGLVEQGVTFDNARVAIPEQNTLFDVQFQNMDGAADQLTVFGDGGPEPLQLSVIRFMSIPTTGNLVHLVDTLDNGDSLYVEMMSTTPAQGDKYTRITGEARASWPKLYLSSFPAAVDSAVPFTITVGIMNPDSTVGYTGGGNMSIALEANPAGNVLGGTLTQGFGGVSASWNDLTLLLPGAGTTFRITIDGQPTDTLITPALSIFNPAPLGAISWDGEGGDGLWSTATNWAGDVVPAPGDSVFLPGNSAVIFEAGSSSISGLVLGIGASLSIDPGQTLTVSGSLTAGTTIYGSGNLVLAGSLMPVTGVINTPTTITGTVSTYGNVVFNSDLTVDGSGAELNIGGAKVTVIGVFQTANGGILTMDGPTDSLFANEAAFNGGSTAASLTAGALIITGADFTQGGPDPASFAASGSHVTAFADAGDNTNVFFAADPASSYFANVQVWSPNGVNFTSATGRIGASASFTVADNAEATLDTIQMAGSITMEGPGSTLTAGELISDGPWPVIQGNWNVDQIVFTANATQIPAFGGYKAITTSGLAPYFLGPVTARSVQVTAGTLNLAGQRVHADSLLLFGSGKISMLSPADTLIVDSLARFQGGNTSGLLGQGLLELHGNFHVGDGATYFNPAPGHVTRFSGAPTHLLNLPGEVNASFGKLIVDSGIAYIDEDFSVTGDLVLNNGSVLNNNDGSPVLTVLGNVLADNGLGTALDVGELNAYSGLTFNGDTASFDVPIVRLWGSGVNVPGGLPFKTVMFLGDATLTGTLMAEYAVIGGSGVLQMGATNAYVDSMIVTGDGHLLMQDPASALNANGWVMFQGDSSEGDYTAGTIRAANFITATGPSGDARSFVQTGTNRIVPQAGDTIQMTNAGPAGSRLQSLVLQSAGGPIYTGEVWIADSLVIDGPSEGMIAIPGGYQVSVGFAGGTDGTFYMLDGTLQVDALAVGGALIKMDGTYDVGLTKFMGAGQLIPSGLPYKNVEVQYAASLTGGLTLPAGSTFSVGNFGDLTLAGNILAVDTFRTSGLGVLRMENVNDTLRTAVAYFGGGSTAGIMTFGGIETGQLYQTTGLDAASFAPSGLHTTTFENLGDYAEGGRDFGFDSPGAAASHFANVRFLATDGVNANSNVYVTGTTYINNTFDGAGRTFTGVGEVAIGPGATVELDTLRLLDTLVIDPSAGMTVTMTIFGPGADPMPASYPYGNVGIEGLQSLTGDVGVDGSLILLNGGILHLNTHKMTVTSDFAMYDSSRLIMAMPTDTLVALNAYFLGDSTESDLSGGTITLSGGLLQSDDLSPKSFRPTGTKVRFVGNGLSYVTFESPDSVSGSYFGAVSIEGSTVIQSQAGLTTTGLMEVEAGATFQVETSLTGIYQIHHWGPVNVAVGGSYANGSFVQSTFHTAPSILGNYGINYAALDGVSTIPDLPWYSLDVRNGGNITLTSDLTATGYLNFDANTVGDQDVTLNGFNISAGGFATSGFATITMTDPGDTLTSGGYVNFNGGSTAGRLMTGLIQTAQGVLQSGSNSPSSFRSSGTIVEFTNPSLQGTVQLDNPDSSWFAGVRAQSTNQLWLRFNSNATLKGVMSGYSMNIEANPSTLISIDTVQAGPGGASITLPALRTKALFGSMGTYNVDRTEYAGNGTIPNLFYDTLLVDGPAIAPSGFAAGHLSVNDTLTVPTGATVTSFVDLVVAGADGRLVLAGGTVNVSRDFITTSGGTWQMDSNTAFLSINRDALIGGGSSLGLLNNGVMQVGGDLTQSGDPFSLVAQLQHTVNFTGGGEHAVTLANPITTEFGQLSLTSIGFDTDTLLLSGSQVRATVLKASGNGRIISNATQLKVTGLNVDGLNIQRTLVQLNTPTPNGLIFDDVAFSGYDPGHTQLEITTPGQAGQITFTNVDFDNVADGTTGYFVKATDTDGVTDFLSILIYGPDSSVGLLRSLLLGGALLSFLPPS